MDVISATFANGRQAIVDIDREAIRNNKFSFNLLFNTKTLQWQPQPTPSAEAPGDVVCFIIKTMPLERQTAPS
jgi:hypothetical protein